MTEILYTAGKESGSIHWTVAEKFSELEGKRFSLNKMEATQIEEMKDLSITAKILLSAVAGAVIQHLIDKGTATGEIFTRGSFIIKL